MATVLEFDELPEGMQVMLATQSGGNLIGRAVPAGGGGGGAAFTLINVGNADHVFNADGSGGAVQIEKCSIISCQLIDDAPRTWKLADLGVASVYVVLFNIEGADPGAVTITDQDDTPMITFNETSTTGDISKPVIGAYWDGDAWNMLSNVILAPS